MHALVFQTRGRRILILSYTAVMLFLLGEKFWVDYCYHVIRATYSPLALIAGFFSHLGGAHSTAADHGYLFLKYILGAGGAAGLLLAFSFALGRGSTRAAAESEIPHEWFYTILTLYVAYSVGLLGALPFFEFLRDALLFLAILGVLYVTYHIVGARFHGRGQRRYGLFADWLMGSVVLAVACFGFSRAVSDSLGTLDEVAGLRRAAEYWKDVTLYVLLGSVILQGMYRLVLYFERSRQEVRNLNVRLTLWGCYFAVVVGSILVLGLSDMAFLRETKLPLADLLKWHIYGRDIFMGTIGIVNSGWVFKKLFIDWRS